MYKKILLSFIISMTIILLFLSLFILIDSFSVAVFIPVILVTFIVQSIFTLYLVNNCFNKPIEKLNDYISRFINEDFVQENKIKSYKIEEKFKTDFKLTEVIENYNRLIENYHEYFIINQDNMKNNLELSSKTDSFLKRISSKILGLENQKDELLKQFTIFPAMFEKILNKVNTQKKLIEDSIKDIEVKKQNNLSELKENSAKLENASDYIAKVKDMMEDICIKTNIFALNGAKQTAMLKGEDAIEFAPVVEEARLLSANSVKAFAEFRDKKDDIDKDIKNFVGTISKFENMSNATLQDTIKDFQLFDDFDKINESVKMMQEKINAGIKTIQDIKDNIDNFNSQKEI